MKPLKLNGQPFRPQYSAAVERLEQYLDSLPDDEIVNGAALRNKEFGSNTISKAQAQLLAGGKVSSSPTADVLRQQESNSGSQGDVSQSK
jgi:hypothetical protein